MVKGRQDLPGPPLPFPEAKPTDSGQGPRTIFCISCPDNQAGG